MKKFSKVKYFGAVAAALLAVAPIAAPVVSQVASPAVAQAATADNYKDALANTFATSANVTLPSGGATAAFLAGTAKADTVANVTAANTLGSALLKGSVDSKLNDANLRIIFTGYQNLSAAQLASVINAGTSSSYSATIQATDDNGNVLASQSATISFTDNSKATVTGTTVKINDSVASVLSTPSIASSVALVDRNGNTISLSGADFNTDSKWAKTTTDTPTSLADVTFYDTAKNPASDGDAADSVWANPGQLFQVVTLSAPTSTKFSSVDWASAQANSKGLLKYDATAKTVTIYRPVTISTGNNDQQLYPIFDYAFSAASADQGAKVVTYTNGQTVALNAADSAQGVGTFYPATQGTNLDTITAGVNKIIGNLTARQNATINADGSKQGTITIDTTKTAAAVASVVGGNLYKAGTYKIPVSVQNKAGFTSTVYIPVTIGYAQNAPVAVSFTPYTEITKGSSFDKFAGIQFQNSASDTTAIPESSVTVSGDVDTTTPGTYTLTYTVKNSQGNTATFTRTVVVKDGALTESNADGVVYINKADGAQIYSDQATTSATDKTLDNTTAWKFHSVVKDSAGKIVAYNLGGKQYVKASEVSTSPVKAQAGVFTVNYPANSTWSIAVYNSDLKVQKLIPAKSTWATFGTKTLKDGKSYYNLGGNQWVRTDYGFWNAK